MTSTDSSGAPTRPAAERDPDLATVTALAMAMGEAERRAFLASVFVTDARARAEIDSRVRAMLRQLNREAELPTLEDGTTPPRYRILRLIGRGGMGSVYLAERSDGAFRQQVALKTLHGDADLYPEFVARMAAERQILASLNHPNIARLLDGGTDERGAPYLVMEYVEGCSLAQYCTRQSLDPRARVRLFLKVLAAVQAAHQALVVHRDLKPANILVDGAGEPKLLDFGIAKLLGNELHAAQGLKTETGCAPMTLRFAAPEQVLDQPVTVAVDLYALGLVLYELLVESPPYPAEYLNPARLGLAIATVDPIVPSVAAKAHADRSRARTLSGDLDAILLKALRKRPADRYASVQQFADELSRWLDGRPVEARHGETLYRLRRQLQRHWLPVVAGAAIVAALSMAAWHWRAERDSALASARFLADLMVSVDPTVGAGHQLSARELIDQGAERIRAGLDLSPVVRQRLVATLGQVYLNLGEPARAAAFVEQAAQEVGDIESRLALARLRVDQARYPEALQLLDDLSDPVLHPEQRVWARALRIEADFMLGRIDAGKQGLADWMGALREDPQLTPEGRATAWLKASSLSISTADAGFCRSALHEAEAQVRPAIAADSYWLAEMRRLQARCENVGGNPKLALALGEQALDRVRQRFGPRHPRVAEVLIELSIPLVLLEQYPRATELVEEAIAILEAAAATESEIHANAQLELARIARNAGDPARALALSEGGIARLRSLPNVRPDNLARALNNHALGLADQRQFEAAAAAYEESLVIMQPLGLPTEAYLQANLGRLYCDDLKQAERGAERLHTALALIRQHRMDNGWFLANTESNLGVCLAMAGNFAAAEPLLRGAIEPLSLSLGADNIRTVNAEQRLQKLLEAKARGDTRADVQVYR